MPIIRNSPKPPARRIQRGTRILKGAPASGGGGTVTPVGAPSQASSATSPITGVYGTGQNRTAGNVLVATVTAAAVTSVTAITCTAGGWTKQFEVIDGTGSCAVAFFTFTATGGDAAPQFSSTLTGTAVMTCTITEASGADTSTPLDPGWGTTSGTTGTPVTVTSAASAGRSGGYAVAAHVAKRSAAGTMTWTPGTGFANDTSDAAASSRLHSAQDHQTASVNSGTTPSESITWSFATQVFASAIATVQPSSGVASFTGSGGARAKKTTTVSDSWYADHPASAQVLGHTEPEVKLFGGTYYCYYRDDSTGHGRINLMTSTDGATWTEQGTILDVGSAGAWDSNYVISPSVEFDGSTYYLFYEGNGSPTSKIGYATATSPSGPFTKFASNPILSPTGTGFEQTLVGTPSVILISGTWYLFYHGFNGTNDQVALAWASSPSGTWTRHSSNPVLPVGNWFSGKVAPSSVFLKNGIVYVAIEGDPGTGKWYIGMAQVPLANIQTAALTLNPGSTPNAMFINNPSGWDNDYAQLPNVVLNGSGTYWMYYSGHSSAGSFSLGRADLLLVNGSVTSTAGLGGSRAKKTRASGTGNSPVAPIPFAKVQDVAGSTTAANNTPQISFTSTAGHHLVAVFTRSGGLGTGALTGVTDSAGNTWQLATRGAVSGTSNTRVEVWYCLSAAAVTWIQGQSGTSQTWAWNLQEYSGPTDAQLDVVSPDNSGNASSTTDSTPSISTTGTGDLIVAATHYPQQTGTLQGTTFTALTNFDDSTVGSGRAAYAIANAGSYSATWTLGAAAASGVAIVSFKGTTGTSGSGNATAKKPAASGTGSETFAGSGTPSTKKPTVAATGTNFWGSGGATAKKTAVSSTGVEQFSGTGAPRSKKPTVSGTGTNFWGSGGVVSKKTSSASTGTEQFSGTGAPLSKKPSASGTGTNVSGISGTGNVNLKKPAVSGAGFTFWGTGAPLAKKPAVSATGTETFTGSGSASTKKPSASGAGTNFYGSGNAGAKKPGVSSTGTETFTGAGSVTAKKPATSASGIIGGSAGTGVINLKKSVVSSTGSETFTGSGSASHKRETVSGTGVEVFTGSGGVNAKKTVASGSGFMPLPATGSGGSVAKKPSSSGTGSEAFTGSGAPSHKKIVVSGIGSTGDVIGSGGASLKKTRANNNAGVETYIASGGGNLKKIVGLGSGTQQLSGTGTLQLKKVNPLGISVIFGLSYVTGRENTQATVSGSSAQASSDGKSRADATVSDKPGSSATTGGTEIVNISVSGKG